MGHYVVAKTVPVHLSKDRVQNERMSLPVSTPTFYPSGLFSSSNNQINRYKSDFFFLFLRIIFSREVVKNESDNWVQAVSKGTVVGQKFIECLFAPPFKQRLQKLF